VERIMTLSRRTEGPTVPSTGGDPCAFSRDQVRATFQSFVWFLRRQRTFIVTTALAVAAMSLSMTYLVAPVYTAQAAIVVERTRNPILRNEKERPLTAIEHSNDLRDMLRSRPVIEAVVEELRPHEPARRQSKLRRFLEISFDRLGILAAMPLRERFIRRWGKMIVVDADDDFVRISFTHEDPALATAVVNAVVDAHRSQYVKMLRASQGLRLRRDLMDRAQLELTSLREILAAHEAPASANAVGFAEALSRLRVVRELIWTIETQTLALRSSLGPAHPDTIASEQTGKTLRAAFSALETEIRTLEQTAARSEEMNLLIRASRETLDGTRERVDRALMLEQSDTRTLNLRVAEYAAIPAVPNASRLFQLMIGIAAGLIFAFSAAIIRDRMKPQQLSVDVVERILRSPVRAVVGDVAKAAGQIGRPAP
jgi:uncharacterized protein involved in exopolysaccharide biosynthesis